MSDQDMLLLTRQHCANTAASKWWLQYLAFPGAGGVDPTRIKTHQSLLALGDNPTTDQVDAVTGNVSWTRLDCSCCYEEVPRVVVVDVTHGEYSTHICRSCVDKMAALFV